MLSALFFDVVDGIRQFFINFLAPENINYRIEAPPNPRDSLEETTVATNSSHPDTLLAEAHEVTVSNSRSMKLKNRFNRWSFVSQSTTNFVKNNNGLPPCAADGVSRSSSCLVHPAEVESIELSYRSTRGRDLVKDVYGHYFAPIPLEVDTFCDFCKKPIYGLGYGPVCQRCAGCHMTCHWICRGLVRVYCQGTAGNENIAENKGSLNEDKPSTSMPTFEETIRPSLEKLSVKVEEQRTGFPTLSTITSVDCQTLSTHSASTNDVRLLQSDATDTLQVSQSASSTILADQVAHISLVKKRETQALNEPTRLHKYDQQLPGQDHLLPQKDDRRASEFSLFDDSFTLMCHDSWDRKSRLKNQNLHDTMYYTASSELTRPEREMFDSPTTSNEVDPQEKTPSGSPAFFTPRNFSSKPSLVRHETDLSQRRRPKKTNLTTRHSFLAGHGSDATIYSRLSYDFSSLDKEAIRAHGIRVRQVIPNTAAIDKPPGLPVSHKHPPLPPQRKSSLLRPRDGNVSASPSPSPEHVELGFASVMQNTEAFVKSKPKYGKRTVISPVSPVPLTSMVVGPRSRLPYPANELSERVASFNKNEFGLQACIVNSLPEGDCEGQVRIHINLLRPIRMLLRPRPASIFDIVGKENEVDEEDACDFSWESPDGHSPMTENANGGYPGAIGPKSAVTSNAAAFPANLEVPFWHQFDGKGLQAGKRSKSSMFWVPRGSTKVLHVRLSTTAQKVISTLLDRFQIEDNPQKFALYEHTIEGDQEVSVRKLFDDESPLGLLLRWTEKGPEQFNQLLGVKRLVLQENETGDIEWSGFSLPELTVFLGILNQEEADYRRRIEMKFEVRRKEILRLMALCEKEEASESSETVSTGCTTLVRELSDGETDQQDGPMPSGPSDSLSTPASPLLRVRTDAILSDLDSAVPECHLPGSPTNAAVPGTASTLPRMLGTEDRLISTLFKPSQYKQSKKAERAQKKRLAKIERERIKAEKKRLKSEAKSAQQNTGTHSRKWLTGLSAAFSSTSAASSDGRSILNS